jgi:carboxyl-terminal processing protease
MNPRRSAVGPLIVLILALTIGGWFLQQGIAQEESSFTQSRLLDEVVSYIADQYVDSVDRDSLYSYAVQGILDRLGDPNTSLLGSQAYEDFRIQTQGDYGGVGLQIVDRGGDITVVSPIPGTPGSRAGIRPGDVIVEVDGVSTRGWSAERAVDVLRGDSGSEVSVRIQRPGIPSPIAFTLVRAQIQLHSVPFATMLEGNVGYVPLRMFSETSAGEVQAAADSLRREGATSLVLDLRENPGGVLDQGVGVADLFLDAGSEVVETRGKQAGPNGTFRATAPDRYAGMPVVVLVDRGSASASEIVAGALQDWDRALLIGNPTYGKGSVQSLFFGLAGGNTLKLTTARWYTPLGRSIERMSGPGTDRTADIDSLALNGHLPITVSGQYAIPPDTAGRPTVTSNGGRTLYGGGGIVPDVLISGDTLSSTEQDDVRAILEEAGSYATGRFNYAVEYLQRHEGVGPDFEVGEAEVGELYDRLSADEGFDVDRQTFEGASRFVELDLAGEIALQGWGEQGAFLRRLANDEPVQAALSALRQSQSPEDLFSITGGPIPDASPPGPMAEATR